MLIIGAGGFAKELVEIFQHTGNTKKIAFYDDVNLNTGNLLFNKFPILKSEKEVAAYFSNNGNAFTIGIGNPALRYKMYKKFTALNGRLTSVISPKAFIGSFEVSLGEGCNVLDGATFSNTASAGMACIVYYNAIITHDCSLGDFCQMSPGATLLGGAKVNDFTIIGSNATILPKILVGKHAVIGAASVVTKDVPDYALMIGNPAKHSGWVSEYGQKLFFDENNIAICNISGDRYSLKKFVVERILVNKKI
jgi:sugar O-acyltransferase (sialic acid O-acetyltransferase NeuD family)